MSLFKLNELEKNTRFCVFPIKYPEVWEMYKKHISTFWVVEEVPLSDDLNDWHNKLNENERFFIKNILAFFAASDGIVNENLVLNFYKEIEIPEVRQFYSVQIMIESVHCVSPDTKILTNKGYFTIEKLKDTNVDVWNGYEFSNVIVKQTSEKSQLYNVSLSNGMELKCTSKHKWHIRSGNNKHPELCKNIIKYTSELCVNDIIITNWEYPNINVNDPDEFLNPYTHGFFCADGSYSNNYPIIELYNDKKKNLLQYLNISSFSKNDKRNSILCYLTNKINKEKFFVPINYCSNTKLRWLEGFCDGDGCSNLNPKKNCQSIQLSSINKQFLQDIQLLLSTLGIDSSIRLNRDEGYRLLPTHKNNEYTNYLCKKCYCLYISCFNTVKLYNLGFRPKRVILHTINQDIKSNKSLIKITNISYSNDDKTFCFNEPKNHTGIFNGIITGQSEQYSLLIDTYISDTKEKNNLFNAMDTNEAVKHKTDWALKWMNSDTPLIQRLLAFVCVEGIFFSGSFCAIYWLKNRGLMPGLSTANNFIARDEGLHASFAILLYNMIEEHERLDESIVHSIFKDAVDIETLFITKSLPVSLLGMNNNLMTKYIKYVADRWLVLLNYNKIFNESNPFDFMDMISLNTKESFFEVKVTSYQKAGVNQNEEQRRIVFDDDEDF